MSAPTTLALANVNDNDGMLRGGAACNLGGVAGSRSSLRLSRPGHVAVPIDPPDFDFGNRLTLALWFRTRTSPAGASGLLAIDDSRAWKARLRLTRAGLSVGVRHPTFAATTAAQAFAPGTYADGAWHHVGATFDRSSPDGARLKLYVDGMLRAGSAGLDYRCCAAGTVSWSGAMRPGRRSGATSTTWTCETTR